MNVVVSNTVVKFVNRLNEPIKSRVRIAIAKLAKIPPQGDIKAMSKNNEYRLRVGNYRILFSIEGNDLTVHDIGLRGQIYKKRR